MSEFIPVTDQNFQKDVLEAALPVVVDFGATWCNPCKMLEPVVKQLAQEWGNRVCVVKADVDQCPQSAARFGVMTVPTLMLFIKGQPLERITGYQPKDRIAGKFNPLIK